MSLVSETPGIGCQLARVIGIGKIQDILQHDREHRAVLQCHRQQFIAGKGLEGADKPVVLLFQPLDLQERVVGEAQLRDLGGRVGARKLFEQLRQQHAGVAGLVVFVIVQIIVDGIGIEAPEGKARRLKGDIAVLRDRGAHVRRRLPVVVQVGDGDLLVGLLDLDRRALDHDGHLAVRFPLLPVEKDADIIDHHLVHGLDDGLTEIADKLVV